MSVSLWISADIPETDALDMPTITEGNDSTIVEHEIDQLLSIAAIHRPADRYPEKYEDF